MTASPTANGMFSKPAYNDTLWDVQNNANWDKVDDMWQGRNLLTNGAFRVQQRAAGAKTDDTYSVCDRFYVLTQTASITDSALATPEDGFPNALRLTQSQASAQRFGFAQIVEGGNCKHGRGRYGVLSGRVRCSAATTIRYAILGWTGTEDAVTSDWVLDWTNGTFTAGNFFTSTSTSVLGTGSLALSANTWTQLTDLVASLGSSFTNLAVIVWTNSTQAQNVTLDCDALQLEIAGLATATRTPLERRPYASELLNCYRYYYLRTWTGTDYVAVVTAASTTQAQGKLFDFPVPMRTAPTPSIVGAGGFVGWNATISGNVAFTTFTMTANISTLSLTVGILNSANFTGGGQAALVTANGSTTAIGVDAEL